MRIYSCLAAVAMTASLAGCYTYPVYQSAPIARLTPEQSAALANSQPLTQADRDRYARDSAQVAQQDQAAQAYTYAAPVAPVYAAPSVYYNPYYYGYPYGYGGLYPFYPGLSLSFGLGGGYYHHGGYRGGYRGGYGGGFRGHR